MEPTLRSAQVLKKEAEDIGFEWKDILEYVKEQQKLDREERAAWREDRKRADESEEKKRADEIMIDFIITRRRNKMDVCSTRVMRGANCWTDHQMLRSKLVFPTEA